MAKRNAEGRSTKSKKPKEEVSSDSENEGDTTNLAFSYPPDEMRIYVEEFQEFLQDNELNVKHLEKLATEWAEKKRAETGEIVDVTTFCTDYRKYLKSAMRVSKLQLRDSALITRRTLSNEGSLEMFADFPPRPTAAIQLYIKKKNLSRGIFELAAAHEAFKTESAEVISEINEEHKELERAYTRDLATFLNNHPNLTETQLNWINAKIRTITKRIDPTTQTPRKAGDRSRKPKKEPETAFTLWARTKTDKWRELSETDRNAKLVKKFAKLTDGEVKLLEELAMSAS